MQAASPRSTLADRTYRVTSAVGIAMAVAWAALWAWIGIPPLLYLALCALGGLCLARLFRFRLGYPLATRLSMAACLVTIVGGILATGGMDGPLGVMLILLPLAPALALGTTESLRWGALVLLLGGGIWGWEALLGPLPSEAPGAFARPLRLAAQLSVLGGTLLCVYTYGRMNELARQRLRRSRTELEDAHRELQLSQQKLLVSEKMAALGRLSAGMAHEINSTLSGALNALELARLDADELQAVLAEPSAGAADAPALTHEVRDSVSLALTALGKIAAFVKRMRGQTTVVEASAETVFSAAEEAETVLRLLQVSLVDRQLTLRTEISRDARLRGDPARFGQIVQNLVANAMDAHEGAPGTVAVRVYPLDGSVMVEVEDDGTGIPEEIRDRIFDHFFTTKGVGRGSGLGLAMVHDLVTSYFGGTVEFHSEVGKGTSFLVRLPANETR